MKDCPKTEHIIRLRAAFLFHVDPLEQLKTASGSTELFYFRENYHGNAAGDEVQHLNLVIQRETH